MTPTKEHIAVTILLHSVLILANFFAHQHTDQLWIWSQNTIAIMLFAVTPLLGGAIVWYGFERIGGILLFGSLPAAMFFNIETRFFLPSVPPMHPSAVELWTMVYNLTFILVLVVEFYCAYLAFRLLRSLHGASVVD